jgi:hypothetical protein
MIAFVSASVLCASVLVMVEAMSYQAHRQWAVDGALVAGLTLVAGFVAALAREIYRKPEDPEDVGAAASPAPGAPASASEGNPEGAKIEGQP